MTNKECGASRWSMSAATSSAAYAMKGKAQCHSQSSSTGAYAVCRRARLNTMSAYPIPAAPQVPMASAALETTCHGMLKRAEINRAAQKWTTVGVPKAPTVSARRPAAVSAPSAITTNCRPVSAAPEEPMMT